MRTTFAAIHRNAESGIEDASSRLMGFQRQISTGLRIEKPSDDPSATLASIGERNETAAIDQYARATDNVGSRLAVVDTVLSDLITQLTSAQVAAASASGTNKTPAQREAAAIELEALRDTVFTDLTSAFNGSYLFSGANSTVPPYTRLPGGPVSAYAGVTAEMVVDVDRRRAVKVAFDGEGIAQGSDPQDIFVEFDALIAAVRAGNAAGIDAGRAAMQRMFDRVSAVQGRVGADLRTIDEQRLRLGELKRASAARRSALEDVNMAEAISNMTHAEAAYRAALGAAGTVTRQSLMDYVR
jgi:flagellar hook-associated protein 3 FlgL